MPGVLPLSKAQIEELVNRFFWDTYGAESTLLGDIDLRIERVASAIEKLALPTPAVPAPISTMGVEELIRQLLALEMARDQPGAYWSYPEDGTEKLIKPGVTRVNFFTGEIEFPDGTKETFKDNLQNRKLDYIRTLHIESNREIIIWFDMATAGKVKRKYFGNVSLRELRIYTSVNANISLWACTKENATAPSVVATVSDIAKVATPAPVEVNAIGNNVVWTPASGKKVRVKLIHCWNSGAADNTVFFRFGAAGSAMFKSLLAAKSGFIANLVSANWEGAVDEVLFVNLSAAQTLNVTVMVDEI